MSIDMSQFHQAFFEESFEGLEIMESELLDLDVGAGDADIINTIFRAAHSIKGGAGTFGFMNVSEFTHVMETLLDEMRDGSREVTQFAVDALLQSVDVLRTMLEAARDNADVDEEMVAERYAILEGILKEGAEKPAEPTQNSAEIDVQIIEETAVEEPSVKKTWGISFAPHPDLLMTGNNPVHMFEALKNLGEVSVAADISKVQPFLESVPEDLYISWNIKVTGELDRADIVEVFEWVEDECDLSIKQLDGEVADQPEEITQESEPAPAPLASPEKSELDEPAVKPKPAPVKKAEDPKAKVATKKNTEGTSIRVGIDKVDEIINLVGELVITQSMLGQAGEDLEAISQSSSNGGQESKKENAEILQRLNKGFSQLERNTGELQEAVMRIRMLPISFVFSRMPRLVHDLSSKLNKDIELVVSGEETELDKIVMENIGDPMVHLVRNALDHGIETPEKRIAAGKPGKGILSLNAFHQGGKVIIQIKDDGAGINKEKVLSKAIEKGLVAEDANLSSNEINNLIFAPGFSTADVVSDVSGRGVGMDVVKTSITSLGGNVTVTSEEGKGSTFTVSLPLTLAILEGQLVTVGNESYVIPLITIIESLQVDRENISQVAGKAEVYQLRESYIPIIRAREVFGLEDNVKDLHKSLMVVVEVDGSPIGIIVDDLQGQQQVVIKSLETNYRKVETMSGATILGDGTVALIWDVIGMLNVHKQKSNNSTSTAKA